MSSVGIARVRAITLHFASLRYYALCDTRKLIAALNAKFA
jgi:hypothetical protein